MITMGIKFDKRNEESKLKRVKNRKVVIFISEPALGKKYRKRMHFCLDVSLYTSVSCSIYFKVIVYTALTTMVIDFHRK